MSKRPRKKLTDGALRKCMSVHWCCVCNSPISLGEMYYDAGPRRRAHVGDLSNDCAGMASRGECREFTRQEQDEASEAYWRLSAKAGGSMTLDWAKRLLAECVRDELHDRAFSDREVYWQRGEETLAEGYFGPAGEVVVMLGGHTFRDADALQLRSLGSLGRVEGNGHLRWAKTPPSMGDATTSGGRRE